MTFGTDLHAIGLMRLIRTLCARIKHYGFKFGPIFHGLVVNTPLSLRELNQTACIRRDVRFFYFCPRMNNMMIRLSLSGIKFYAIFENH
jgi:hypothetical protein